MSPRPFVLDMPFQRDPSVLLRKVRSLPFPLLLESIGELRDESRHSFLAVDPVALVTARGRATTVSWKDGTTTTVQSDPLDAVRALVGSLALERIPGLPPFQGGAAGFIGYEYGQLLERIPDFAHDDLTLPDVMLPLYDCVIAWDRDQETCSLFSTGLSHEGTEVAREARARSRAHGLRALLEQPDVPGPAAAGQFSGDTSSPAPTHPVEVRDYPLHSSLSREQYVSAIERIREYIRAGDIFQANFTQRFSAPVVGDPLDLFGRLRETSPAPFAAYFDFGEAVVMSASPERFLRAHGDGSVETRPIKGTRPRSDAPAEDSRLSAELVSSEKDRAEHVMIVDVLRNDLSRVCVPGSVDVPDLLTLRHYLTVHHLVSTVVGRLEEGRDMFDLLQAAFPGGSITGAPKIRAMEIIAELEPVRRNVYCGAIGYFGHNGEMDSSIVIRTMVQRDGVAYFSAGGGIVADSDPEAEFAECLDKIRGIVDALRSAS